MLLFFFFFFFFLRGGGGGKLGFPWMPVLVVIDKKKKKVLAKIQQNHVNNGIKIHFHYSKLHY